MVLNLWGPLLKMKNLENSTIRGKFKRILNTKSLVKHFFIISALVFALMAFIFLLYFVIDDSDHKNYALDEPVFQSSNEVVNRDDEQASQSSSEVVNNVVSNERESTSKSSISQVANNVTSKEYDFSNWNKYCDWNLIVINNQNELPQDFGVKLGKYREKELDYRIIDDLMNMMEDAYKDGVNLWISSGYRDLKLQAKLFGEEVANFKDLGYSNFEAERMAEKNVARSRRSEHNTGLAIDFNGVRDDFVNTKEYKWLVDNSINYGFILRYSQDKVKITGIKFEPWHFRYVGKEIAIKVKDSNLCLEEYISQIM